MARRKPKLEDTSLWKEQKGVLSKGKKEMSEAAGRKIR